MGRGELPVVKRYEQTSHHPGSILREIREEQNLSRNCVVDHIDIGHRHLTAIELGEKCPSVETLKKLLRYYGASADRIFYPEMYAEDGLLRETTRLLASCTPKQLQLIKAFIKMLRDQKGLDL